MKDHYFESIATLTGTIIGAGILGIPYVVSRAGFLTGFLVIFMIGFMMMLLHLYLGEITLRTKGIHQLTGYAKKYLGKKGKFFMTIAMIIGIYGALVAYVIGEGSTFAEVFGGSSFLYSLFFLIICSGVLYIGLNAVAKSEKYMVYFIILIIAIISFLSIEKVQLSNLAEFNITNFFMPYGVVLFAFLGTAAVPVLKEELNKNKKKIKKAIIFGTLIPLAIYLLFAFIVVGINGLETTEVATIGLGHIAGKAVMILGNFFAIFAMATSYLALGLALKGMYIYDYNINEKIAWTLTWIVPLIFLLSGITGFVDAINFSGVISGGLTGILIVMMISKAKKRSERKPEYNIIFNKFIGAILVSLFLLGVIYYLWSLI